MWMLRRHHIATAVRPHNTHHHLLVHPKATELSSTPQKQFTPLHIKTAQRYTQVRMGQDRRSIRRIWTSQKEYSIPGQGGQSLLTALFVYNNHTINGDGVRLPVKEVEWTKRIVKKAISIRKAVMCAINSYGGHHHLHKIFKKLIYHTIQSSGIFVALMKVPVGFEIY